MITIDIANGKNLIFLREFSHSMGGKWMFATYRANKSQHFTLMLGSRDDQSLRVEVIWTFRIGFQYQFLRIDIALV